MIRTVDLARTYGVRTLFAPTSWFLADRDRVGLVGPNGSGKSTWLKMLAGLEPPDSGRVEMPKGQRVGYLPQFGFEPGRGTVREESKRAFAGVLELQRQRGRLEEQLSAGQLSDEEALALLERHDRIEQEIRLRDGYEIDRQVDLVLRGLGFQPGDYDRPVGSLSGGWQMRVALARILLERPEVLLLDEPTNHLDIEAREWLEGFLREYPGAFIVVSHDRYFLDVTVSRITEIFARRLVDYEGGYSRYLAERQVRYEAALKAYERQQDEIRRIQTFIDRFRAKNTKATQVQSRVKMLEKMERLEAPQAPPRSIRFRFPQPHRTGRIVLELREVRKAYGPVRVFEKVDLILERGQKVALVGPNGAGKSTLMRILAGTERFEEGERREGLRVTLDHFAQDEADRLPPQRTILEEALARSPNEFVPQVRGLLGAFLFSGDEVEKRIGVLSGGERNRLALAFMLMRPSSVLLLDEPTNHLDIEAKDVLLEALRSFDGTVVFVSHDRYFLDGLADRVIEAGGGVLRDHPGDYESYLWKKEKQGETPGGGPGDPHATAGGSTVPVRDGPRPDGGSRDGRRADGDADPQAEGPRRGRRGTTVRRQVRELETRIAELESRRQKLEGLLSREDLYRDAEKSSFYLGEYRQVSRELEEAMEAWSEVAGDLENFEK